MPCFSGYFSRSEIFFTTLYFPKLASCVYRSYSSSETGMTLFHIRKQGIERPYLCASVLSNISVGFMCLAPIIAGKIGSDYLLMDKSAMEAIVFAIVVSLAVSNIE